MKDLKISKELFKEVLGEEVIETGSFNYPILEINVQRYSYREWQKINICEFAFKCKEWAKNKEYIVHSSPTQKIEHTAIVQSFDFNKFYYGQNQFYALTEVEAIIQACEWILKHKENQCTK